MWKGAGAKEGSVWQVKERRFLSPNPLSEGEGATKQVQAWEA